MADGAAIPTLDMGDLLTDDPTRRDRASRSLRHGFGELGLITLTGHGIDPDELDTYYAAYLQFLDRPREQKEAFNRPEIWYQRGWTPPNTERAVVAGGQPDLKECWFAAPLPLDPFAAKLYPEIYAANIWPEDADTFRDLHLRLGKQLHEVGIGILGGCERALGLDDGALTGILEGAAHVTRALAYLPLSEDHVADDILWGEEHTDFNLLTLLPGGRFFDHAGRPIPRPDDRAGLYLRTRPTEQDPRGRMVRGRPPKGHLVSQVGQQLEILTGGTFQATPHVIKAPLTPGIHRTSLAHFVHVHALRPLAPLEPLRTEAALEAYRPPVLAGTYALKTLVDIGLAPPQTLDAFGYRHYDRLATIRQGGEW